MQECIVEKRSSSSIILHSDRIKKLIASRVFSGHLLWTSTSLLAAFNKSKTRQHAERSREKPPSEASELQKSFALHFNNYRNLHLRSHKGKLVYKNATSLSCANQVTLTRERLTG